MKLVRLSDAARRDLEDIAQYSGQEWGEARKQACLLEIKSCFQRLSHFPDSGAPRDEIAAGYRSAPVGHHVVFYRQTESDVIVIRVLHERMDLHRQLRSESERP